MIKDDEKLLYNLIRECHRRGHTSVKAMADSYFEFIGMNYKRGYYLLRKWSDKGWWDYGVSLRTGWFTQEAPESM